MLKARLTKPDGRHLIVVGLSGENVTRLAAGEPIHAALEPIGVAADLVVLYGKTEADLEADLKRLHEAIHGGGR